MIRRVRHSVISRLPKSCDDVCAPDPIDGDECCIEVARVENLADIPTGTLHPYDAQAKVRSLRGTVFVLDRTSTATIDGITVAATDTGTGRWIRVPTTVPAYLRTDSWVVNALTGDDQNEGFSTFSPLRTHAELERRVGVFGRIQPPSGVLTISILTDLPDSDPIGLLPDLARDCVIRYEGALRVKRSGTLASVTNRDEATNQPWVLTSIGAPWAADVGTTFGVLTSGASSGYFFPIAKDLGSDQARVGESMLVDAFESTYVGAPGALDTYDIVEAVKVTYGRIDMGVVPIDYTVATGFSQVSFRNFYFRNETFGEAIDAFGQSISFIQCIFDTAIGVGGSIDNYFLNCIFKRTMRCIATLTTQFVAGLVLGTSVVDDGALVALEGAEIFIDENTLFQGNGFNGFAQVNAFAGATVTIGSAGFFDSQVDAIVVDTGCAVRFGKQTIGNFYNGPGKFWGSGAVGLALHIHKGGQGTYADPALLTATGLSGQFSLGPDQLVRVFDDTTATFTAPIATTWANLSIAVGAGGFGQNAVSVVNNAALMQDV